MAPYRDRRFRLGFEFAASGQGDLAAIYVDEKEGDGLWLRGLVTCRTEGWHFPDITWAGALATHVHLEVPYSTGPLVA